ncbi:flagellar basal body protein FliL [Pseudonocardia nigra]|uniref:flagellar basal body protein FliL n=1 Tax=Pseudonocardia nigra TaxID=1921578 RepID=UPI001C5E9264|nr:flagellar basal body protein FliL [Pseudonocardia nigra]
MPPPASPKRRRGPIVAAVAAVLALVAGSVAAVVLLGGRGGADTARESVELLAADLSQQRWFDAFGRLHPAEAELLTDLGEVVTDELVRLEVFRPDADLDAAFSGATVSDLRFDEAAAEQVRPDVVITKLVAGTITFDQDPAALPFTDSFRRLAFPDGLPAATPTTIDLADVVAEQGEPIRLASVRVEGSWYVSLFYTAADYALRSEGLSWPATSVPARGAATPGDALRETVQAMLDGDVPRLVELAPSGELQVVHDLGDVIVAEAPAEPSGARITELETTETDVRGDTALQVTRVVVETPAGDRVTVTRSGDCLDISGSDGSAEQVCGPELFGQALAGAGDPTLDRLAPRILQAVLDVRIVTVGADGAHYVSPGRTAIALYAEVLRALEPEDIAELFRSMR